MSLSSALGAAAALGLTLIVYMGVQRLAHIQAGLLTALGADTPAALVQHASTAQERRLVTTLGRVPADDVLPQAPPLRAAGARSMI